MKPRDATELDKSIGIKIRMYRRAEGLKQQQLADCLQISFQQLQKYERGSNRIPASRLYELASVLKRNINEFFEG